MTQTHLHGGAERRHPHISHEELRRQLIEADEDRYRLQSELYAFRSEPRHAWSVLPRTYGRLAAGVGTLLVIGLAGGLVWQMCPSSVRADDRSSVRVETTVVTPRLIVTASKDRPAEIVTAKPAVRVSKRARAPRRPDTLQRVRVERPARKSSAPRPLSPGEFGRKAN